MSEREVEMLHRMTPAEKLEVMGHLIRQAYELKASRPLDVRPAPSGRDALRSAEAMEA